MPRFDTVRGLPRTGFVGRISLALKKIGDVQARVLLTILYFTLVAPFALIVRWTSDPLTLKATTPRGWHVRTAPADPELDQARKQF
jgi:hypothetical protein